jgi:Ca-activated chloride channel homolog
MSSALALLLLGTPSAAKSQDAAAQSGGGKPTFRSAVDLVSVAAVVRDRHGRFARNLKKDDFIIHEGGFRREVLDFRTDENAPVRVALLFDVSGSMRIASHLEDARQAARYVLSSLHLDRDADEAAVFSFDMNLQTQQPFTSDAGAIENALSRVQPYGQTSLYDAIGETAQHVAETRATDRRRRAVVVFTDGIDTSSLMTPEQVSAIASEIDVPVYVVTVVSQSMHEDVPLRTELESPLGTLARWTGGTLFMTSAPAHQSLAGRQIVDELRHQYLLAFAASNAKGWRPLEVKTKDKDMTVRARSGYAAGTRGS